MRYAIVESPIGPLRLAGDELGLRQLSFLRGRRTLETPPNWIADRDALDDAIAELEAYFGGHLRRFTIKLAPEGTPFQVRVWRALCDIPYGETISYLELARRVGDPKAVRAVGLANGANPLAIVIPCHRVIGSNGSLIGFGGGLPIKRALLALEVGQPRLI